MIYYKEDKDLQTIQMGLVWFMVFNAIFKNICRLSVEKQIHQIKQIYCQSKTQKDRYKTSTNYDDRSII